MAEGLLSKRLRQRKKPSGLPDLDRTPMPIRFLRRHDRRREMRVVDRIGKVLVFEAEPAEGGVVRSVEPGNSHVEFPAIINL